MKTKSLALKISPSVGSVSAECFVPQKSKCIMTLAHGAGAFIGFDVCGCFDLQAYRCAMAASIMDHFRASNENRYRVQSTSTAVRSVL